MKLVQILLTDGQADLVAAALADAEKALRLEITGAASQTADGVERLEEDITRLGRLGLLFQDASENPLKYKPSPANDVVRSIVKAAKVPVPKTRRKRRADRHQRRKAERLFFRRNQALIEGYNEAQRITEAEAKEHAANLAEIQERVKDQPTFTITDGFGNTIMAGIPAEFVIDEQQDVSLNERFFTKPKLYIPSSAEQPAKIVEVDPS